MTNLDFSLSNIIFNLSLPYQWLLFFILIFIVFLSALFIPRLTINLFANISISPIVIGTFLISIITSLPELISILFFPFYSETNVSGEVKSFSNIFGANFLSITILCVLDFLFFRNFFFRSRSVNLRISGLLVIVFNFMFLLSLGYPKSFLNFQIPLLNISVFFLFLIFLYIGFLIWSHRKVSENKYDFLLKKRNLFKYRYSLFLLFAITLALIYLLVFSMLMLMFLMNHFQNIYQISDHSVGGIIFALITSSPEIWSMIGMFWMGFGGGAIGIITGSHLINMLLLVFSDFNNGTNSFADLTFEPSLFFLVFISLISSVILFFRYRFFSVFNPATYFLPAFLVIVNFVLGWEQILIK